ncbi:MAG: response regulator transcription factor [Spirochaetota bacterium]
MNAFPKSLNVIIAEDHSFLRAGLKSVLQSSLAYEVHIKEIATAQQLLVELRRSSYDLLILDLELPDTTGLDLLEQVKQKYPQLKVIVLTMIDSRMIFLQAMQLQVDAYVIKSDNVNFFPQVVEQVMFKNEFYCSMDLLKHIRQQEATFTQKEQVVMQGLGKGYSVMEIAQEMSLSPRTIEYYIGKLKSKLGQRDQSQLIRYIRENYM